MKLNPKTHRKFERAAGKKFVDILHKGHWGNFADCADENGNVWQVNKATGECKLDENCEYRNGGFYLNL